jgi:hypothetical protein
MTTVAELLAQVRYDWLLEGRIRQNKLANTCDADDSPLTFTFPLGQLAESSRISIGLEDMHVWSVNGTSKSAEVDRGAYGTTAASHSAGAKVTVNPERSDAQILRAVNAELQALASDGLYQLKAVELTGSVDRTYPVSATDVIVPWRVYYDRAGSDEAWPEVLRWEWRTVQETDDFPSGNALVVDSYVDVGRQVRLVYKAGFASLTGLGQNVTAVSGLPASAVDLLAVGAALRLLVGREAERNRMDRQGDTRRAEEVPAGSQRQAAAELRAYRTRRLEAEVKALARKHGTARSRVV